MFKADFCLNILWVVLAHCLLISPLNASISVIIKSQHKHSITKTDLTQFPVENIPSESSDSQFPENGAGLEIEQDTDWCIPSNRIKLEIFIFRNFHFFLGDDSVFWNYVMDINPPPPKF